MKNPNKSVEVTTKIGDMCGSTTIPKPDMKKIHQMIHSELEMPTGGVKKTKSKKSY